MEACLAKSGVWLLAREPDSEGATDTAENHEEDQHDKYCHNGPQHESARSLEHGSRNLHAFSRKSKVRHLVAGFIQFCTNFRTSFTGERGHPQAKKQRKECSGKNTRKQTESRAFHVC